MRAPAAECVIVRLATEYGVTADHCLVGTGLSKADLTDPEREIEPGQELAAAANLLDACDEPGVGLIIGSRMHFTAYGIWGLGMMSCPTARETGCHDLIFVLSLNVLSDERGRPQTGVRGRRPSWANYAPVGQATDLTSRYCSKPARPFWRPMPLSL